MKLLMLTFMFSVVNSARILAIFPFPSISHQYIFRAIVKELSLRGHDITFITPNPMKDSTLNNIEEIDISGTYRIYQEFDLKEAFTLSSFIGWLMNSNGYWDRLMSLGLDEAGVKEVLNKPEDSYDLIDLQRILDDAKDGLVYFSLGTNVRFEYVDKNFKESILTALGNLPFTVLCKWETEDISDKPKNVILRKWLPQQSILAHPNVKIFVTQGGSLSTEEAIINGIPLVIIPFLADQHWNAKILTRRGMAEYLSPESITEDLLVDTILKVVKDEKYKIKAQELRTIFLDQPRTGLEEIVWWYEYVIRHKGASHLRSPGADISYYDFLMLDVFVVILVTLFVIYHVMKLFLGIIMRLIKRNKSDKQKLN
ncbi:hypothetical protein HHI36_002712 [Cryptolaemus montrouzieri]|uniref:UDP-glucuronosyltransferase n=1 Tax=Cryptolaemus montrouzieri TaxID=559131 RepID=A0ABD2PBS4_9CUCU